MGVERREQEPEEGNAESSVEIEHVSPRAVATDGEDSIVSHTNARKHEHASYTHTNQGVQYEFARRITCHATDHATVLRRITPTARSPIKLANSERIFDSYALGEAFRMKMGQFLRCFWEVDFVVLGC